MGNPKTQKPESGIQKPESEIRNLESTNQRKQVHQIPEKYFAWLLLVKMKRASKKDLKHFFFFGTRISRLSKLMQPLFKLKAIILRI